MPRLATKATIKRASKEARRNATRLDQEALDDLQGIYQRAAQELQIRVANYGGADGNIRLGSLQQMRGEIEFVLDELARVQRTNLFTRMRQVAAMGIEPVAEMLGADRVAALADSAVKAVRDFVAGDGLQLSDRIWRIEQGAQQVVGQAVANAVIQGHSASEAAQAFLQRGEPVPGYLQQKINGANADRVGRVAGFELLQGDESAYSDARRLFRTEINRAHGTAYQAGVFEHPDVVGTRFLLSPAHPEPDICDMFARVNRYGLGPGVYPPGKSPWPAHPNTLSYEEAVFLDEVEEQHKQVRDDPVEWIKRQPPETQAAVLGGQNKQRALQAGILTNNEIRTPWHVLKKRYEKRGIDVAELVKKPPITLPAGTKEAAQQGLDFGKASKDFNRLANRAFEMAPELVKSVIRNMPKIQRFEFAVNKAYCNARGITLDINDQKPGKEAWADDVTRHEYGHWIDFHGAHKGLDKQDSVWISSTPNRRGGLRNSMTKASKKLGSLSRESVQAVRRELSVRRDAVLADLFGGITRGKIGFGHTIAYYNQPGFGNAEAFANLVCLYSREDKTSWEYAKKVLPELCDDFIDVMNKLRES